ncbi:MAG: hypothetical protein PHQ85_02315 [Eubacteriales bacterium]|nr:hypothetical protein [Eubacteriales bacterium]MDD4104272.1 hypothetical protein [Eubacteriales bacterium]MDD4709781.1 hypothetical protein [Eubacteriales bacterium]
MNKPEEFRQTADEMLGGLVAGQESYQKIIDYQGKRGFAPLELRRMAAFAALFVFMLGIGSVALSKRPQVAKQIETKAAGKEMPQGATMSAWAVPRGSITLSGGGSAPGYLGLWAQGSGANFPLVAVEGRYYRLLTNPTAIDTSMLGGTLGAVEVFTNEPALADPNSVISNVAGKGETVHTVKGMNGAAVAAMVDGNLRVFQRVSFSGNALIGSENLSSVLGKGKVVALQLSGVGTVTDIGEIDRLMDILKSRAIYKGSSGRSGNQALSIEYDNHIVLQLSVNGNDLSGCGVWSNAEFVAAFAQSAQ